MESTGRLKCFDNVVGRWASVPSPTTGAREVSPTGSLESRWSAQTNKSPVDDSPTVTLLNEATELSGKSAMVFGQEQVVLILRCRERELSVFVGTNGYLGNMSIPVTYRFGESPARSESWDAGTGGKAAFIPDRVRSIEFIKLLESQERLVVRISSFGGAMMTATFDIRHLKQQSGPLRNACKF